MFSPKNWILGIGLLSWAGRTRLHELRSRLWTYRILWQLHFWVASSVTCIYFIPHSQFGESKELDIYSSNFFSYSIQKRNSINPRGRLNRKIWISVYLWGEENYYRLGWRKKTQQTYALFLLSSPSSSLDFRSFSSCKLWWCKNRCSWNRWNPSHPRH